MYYVNTLSFNGRKACINSYTKGYIDNNTGGLGDSMREQVAWFAGLFPNATVTTELMAEADVIALVKLSRTPGNDVWNIGEESKKA